MKRIKIIKASKPTYWYADMIGEIVIAVNGNPEIEDPNDMLLESDKSKTISEGDYVVI